MKPEVRDLWVDALESGEYPQTTGMLRRLDNAGNIAGYCCLGVLCDLYERATGNALDVLQWGQLPPTEVRDWAGMNRTDPNLWMDPEEIRTEQATSLNDDCGWDFAQIARAIRNTPPESI